MFSHKTPPAFVPGRRIAGLFSGIFGPLCNWINRKRLEAQLRELVRLADYFEWQARNAREGMADTHKRMAIVRSDLNRLN